MDEDCSPPVEESDSSSIPDLNDLPNPYDTPSTDLGDTPITDLDVDGTPGTDLDVDGTPSTDLGDTPITDLPDLNVASVRNCIYNTQKGNKGLD